MKRIAIAIIVSASCFVAIWRIAPRLGRKAMQECEGMLARMPEDFPPKRVMHSLEEIRRQNARILCLLEERERAATPRPTDKNVEVITA